MENRGLSAPAGVASRSPEPLAGVVVEKRPLTLPAPGIQSVSLSALTPQLVITFDGATFINDTDTSNPCASVFEDHSFAEECALDAQGTSLTADLRQDAMIEPGQDLSLLPNTLFRAGEADLRRPATGGTYSVEVPPGAPIPTPRYEQPAVWRPCGDVFLFAGDTEGLGGMPANFTWSCYSPASVCNATEISEAFAGSSGQSGIMLRIPEEDWHAAALEMEENATMLSVLQIRNAFGYSRTVVISIPMGDRRLPSLLAPDLVPVHRQVEAADGTLVDLVELQVTTKGACADPAEVEVEFQIEEGNMMVPLSRVAEDLDPSPNGVRFAYKNAAGSRLRVIATSSATGGTVWRDVQLADGRIEVIAISGRSLVHPMEWTSLTLTGSSGPVFWTCNSLDDQGLDQGCPSHFAQAAMTNATTIRLPPSNLTDSSGTRYRFTATTKSGTVSHRLLVQITDMVQHAEVFPCSDRLVAGANLRARAEIAGANGKRAMWLVSEHKPSTEWFGEARLGRVPQVTDDQIRLTVPSEAEGDLHELVVPGQTLVPGSVYVPILAFGNSTSLIQLEVYMRDQIKTSGRRSTLPLSAPGVFFFMPPRGSRINRPPAGGLVTIAPETGRALSTPFHVSTSGWQDENPTQLWYELFFVLHRGSEVGNATQDTLEGLIASSTRVMPKGQINKVDPWLAPFGDHAVIARVTDDMGASVLAASRVVVNPVEDQDFATQVQTALSVTQGTNNGFAMLGAIHAVLNMAQISGQLVGSLAWALQIAAGITAPCQELAVSVGTATEVLASAVGGDLSALTSVLSAVTSVVRGLRTIGLQSQPAHVVAGALSAISENHMRWPPQFATELQETAVNLGRLVLLGLQLGESLRVTVPGMQMQVFAAQLLSTGPSLRVGELEIAVAGRRLQAGGVLCERLELVTIVWDEVHEPSRFHRPLAASPLTAFALSCSGAPMKFGGSDVATVRLPIPDTVLDRTNFEYECIAAVAGGDDVEYQTAAPVAVGIGHVRCPVPLAPWAVSVGLRVRLDPPANRTASTTSPSIVSDLELAPIAPDVPPIPGPPPAVQPDYVKIAIQMAVALAVSLLLVCCCMLVRLRKRDAPDLIHLKRRRLSHDAFKRKQQSGTCMSLAEVEALESSDWDKRNSLRWAETKTKSSSPRKSKRGSARGGSSSKLGNVQERRLSPKISSAWSALKRVFSMESLPSVQEEFESGYRSGIGEAIPDVPEEESAMPSQFAMSSITREDSAVHLEMGKTGHSEEETATGEDETSGCEVSLSAAAISMLNKSSANQGGEAWKVPAVTLNEEALAVRVTVADGEANVPPRKTSGAGLVDHCVIEALADDSSCQDADETTMAQLMKGPAVERCPSAPVSPARGDGSLTAKQTWPEAAADPGAGGLLTEELREDQPRLSGCAPSEDGFDVCSHEDHNLTVLRVKTAAEIEEAEQHALVQPGGDDDAPQEEGEEIDDACSEW